MLVINYERLIILIAFSVVCFFLIWRFTYTGIQKMYYIFSVIGMIVYSGLSTVYIGLCDNYFIPYLVFEFVYTICFIIGVRVKLLRKDGHIVLIKRTKEIEKHDYEVSISSAQPKYPNIVFTICLIGFFSYYIIQLLYPEIRIQDLFHIRLSIDNIFERRASLRGNAIYQVFYYINLMSIVFVFIYAYHKFREKKWIIPVAIICAWYYLQMVNLGYMSRNEMMMLIAFVVLIIDNRKADQIKVTPRLVLIGLTVVIIMIPFLNAFEMIRMGVNTQQIGIGESFELLLRKESTYGMYYEFCANYSDSSLVLRYFVWLLTLPLPSALFGAIKSYGLETNTLFTVAYTGIKTGSSNYSVILPSVFGESLLIYGGHLYWIHAVFLGLFFGKFCTHMEKNSDLTLLNLYFAVNLFILGRGGSEAVIASMVNYMIMYLIVKTFLKTKKIVDE